MVGNVVAFMFNVLNHAPWGGLIVLPVVEGRMYYIIAVVAGAVTTALMVNALKKPISERVEEKQETSNDELDLTFE